MNKLDHKRLRPYAVTKVLSNNAYELKLPKSMKIHPVFSVVKLIPFNETEIPEQKATSLPAPILVDRVEEYKIEEIIDSRKRRGRTQYLVKWKGFPTEENTWEPATSIKKDVPALIKLTMTDSLKQFGLHLSPPF